MLASKQARLEAEGVVLSEAANGQLLPESMALSSLPPTLPSTLWPHNFLYFSIFLAVIWGIFNIFTLPTTILAAVLAASVSCTGDLGE